ncbi:hypothetical protein KP803_13875 [Vibrio sp. ZSDE26]|uniref:DNA gyrase subunit B n=1 Tax=Vibrio amylolyticus TaxID=2847292 RepID=A0A9X2BIP6_9VIBR|nr:hypothetical protein [Vibrio amylolyticus]MCK6264365.1 hypothetical protein [Vibrio amylolyticus]
MGKLLTALSAITLLAYPFAVYFGIEQFGIQIIGLILIALFAIRIVSASKAKLKELKQLAWITGITGVCLTMFGLLFKQYGWLTFYPVIVNACMFTLFFQSLRQPQTIIERLARLQEPDLPLRGIIYTRKVTKVWCGFFILNGSIALYTCFQSLEVWTLYNGFISYLCIGVLFAAEWVIRVWVRKRAEHQTK